MKKTIIFLLLSLLLTSSAAENHQWASMIGLQEDEASMAYKNINTKNNFLNTKIQEWYWHYTPDMDRKFYSGANVWTSAALAAFIMDGPLVFIGGNEAGARINVNRGADPVSTVASDEGRFSITVALNPNEENALTVIANNQYGASQPVTLLIVHDNKGPDILIKTPREGEELTASQVRVIGTVTDASEIEEVSVNGTVVALNEAGEFNVIVTLQEGANSISILSRDTLSNSSEASIQVTLKKEEHDTTPLVVSITYPSHNANVAATTRVQGTVTDASPITNFTINGSYVPLAGDSFDTYISLSSEENSITASAIDAFGLQGSDSVAITVDSGSPSTPVVDPIPKKTAETTTTITGRADPGAVIEIETGVMWTGRKLAKGATLRLIGDFSFQTPSF